MPRVHNPDLNRPKTSKHRCTAVGISHNPWCVATHSVLAFDKQSSTNNPTTNNPMTFNNSAQPTKLSAYRWWETDGWRWLTYYCETDSWRCYCRTWDAASPSISRTWDAIACLEGLQCKSHQCKSHLSSHHILSSHLSRLVSSVSQVLSHNGLSTASHRIGCLGYFGYSGIRRSGGRQLEFGFGSFAVSQIWLTSGLLAGSQQLGSDFGRIVPRRDGAVESWVGGQVSDSWWFSVEHDVLFQYVIPDT